MLTLGKDGAVYAGDGETFHQPIFPVQAVDTTAAGDTFTGYFLAGLTEGMPIPEILRMSAKASSIAVTRARRRAFHPLSGGSHAPAGRKLNQRANNCAGAALRLRRRFF